MPFASALIWKGSTFPRASTFANWVGVITPDATTGACTSIRVSDGIHSRPNNAVTSGTSPNTYTDSLSTPETTKKTIPPFPPRVYHRTSNTCTDVTPPRNETPWLTKVDEWNAISWKVYTFPIWI